MPHAHFLDLLDGLQLRRQNELAPRSAPPSFGVVVSILAATQEPSSAAGASTARPLSAFLSRSVRSMHSYAPVRRERTEPHRWTRQSRWSSDCCLPDRRPLQRRDGPRARPFRDAVSRRWTRSPARRSSATPSRHRSCRRLRVGCGPEHFPDERSLRTRWSAPRCMPGRTSTRPATTGPQTDGSRGRHQRRAAGSLRRARSDARRQRDRRLAGRVATRRRARRGQAGSIDLDGTIVLLHTRTVTRRSRPKWWSSSRPRGTCHRHRCRRFRRLVPGDPATFRRDRRPGDALARALCRSPPAVLPDRAAAQPRSAAGYGVPRRRAAGSDRRLRWRDGPARWRSCHRDPTRGKETHDGTGKAGRSRGDRHRGCRRHRTGGGGRVGAPGPTSRLADIADCGETARADHRTWTSTCSRVKCDVAAAATSSRWSTRR